MVYIFVITIQLLSEFAVVIAEFLVSRSRSPRVSVSLSIFMYAHAPMYSLSIHGRKEKKIKKRKARAPHRSRRIKFSHTRERIIIQLRMGVFFSPRAVEFEFCFGGWRMFSQPVIFLQICRARALNCRKSLIAVLMAKLYFYRRPPPGRAVSSASFPLRCPAAAAIF